ncbi:hypothetical protein SLA2020_492400 [Shorea laevis]|uniref:Uncharacterized protein n=1 Tax=Rubroshorea leprosula TaxID=152421 RepID=A0AAV5MWH4_9ROSI|nr:hypothetical protein SLEP1_g59857 [Rubroshorea leprosula]
MLQAKAPQRPAVVPWTFLDALDTSPTPACTPSPLPFHYNQMTQMMMRRPSPFLVPAEESRQKQLAAGVATRSYADCLKGPSVTGDREEFVKLPSTQIDSDGIPFVEWEEESLLLANSRYRFSLIARFAVVGGLLSRRLESGAPRHGA